LLSAHSRGDGAAVCGRPDVAGQKGQAGTPELTSSAPELWRPRHAVLPPPRTMGSLGEAAHRPAARGPPRPPSGLRTWPPPEQGGGGHHDLLQAGGEAALEVQIVQFADACGQGGRVGLHEGDHPSVEDSQVLLPGIRGRWGMRTPRQVQGAADHSSRAPREHLKKRVTSACGCKRRSSRLGTLRAAPAS
jgi:hypothetical protein